MSVLLLLISGCGATHQVVFDPWRGISKELAAELKSGDLPFEAPQVFKAATDALDREPFFKWEFQSLDAKGGMLQASTGKGATLQLVIHASSSLTAKTHLAVTLSPPRVKGDKKVWMNRHDSLYVTAYEIPFSKRDPWEDHLANFELDQDYLISAIYRQLFNQSAVPFALEPIP